MSIGFFIMWYLVIGVSVGLCVEYLWNVIKPGEPITNMERFWWVFLWPVFSLIFISKFFE